MTPDATLGIAVPSFEQGDYVADAIRSLRSLTLPFTAVIQDGGSSPATLDAIRDAMGDDPRFELVVEPDDGQADAINRAWARLIDEHDVLTWLNTDDVAYADGAEQALRALGDDPEAALVYGAVDLIDEDGRTVGVLGAPPRVARFRLVYHSSIIPGILPMVRTKAVRAAGMLDPELHYALDHDLFVRLADHGRLRRAPLKVGAQRLHSSAKTIRDAPEFAREVALVRERYRGVTPVVAEALRTTLRAAWWPMRRWYVRGDH